MTANYKAELKGFCLDRAIRMAEVAKELPKDIFAEADKLVEYLYIEDKDIESHIQALLPMIMRSGSVEKLDELILHLEQFKAEMEAGIRKGVN